MHDDLIAALERSARLCDIYGLTCTISAADAATIRAHITDLRAGNLVRREDVVAQLRALKDQAPPESLWSAAEALADRYERFGNFLSEARQPQQEGAHEGGGGDA